MRAYSAADEEAVHARALLKDWASEGSLTAAQYQEMEQETTCELRRTNIFLRLVLFLFTLIIVGAGVALFFVIFGPSEPEMGVFLLFFAGLSYRSAEFAVSRFQLYRYGIEEALAVCSVAFLCVGIELAFFSGSYSSHPAECLVPAAGAGASIWLWHRFGIPYASMAAMVFAAWLPGYWTSSLAAQHLIVAALYAVGLATVAAMRPRHRFTYLDGEHSVTEAFLWFGIYLAMNLQLSSGHLVLSVIGVVGTPEEFPPWFYWATWVLIWCLPPVMLTRGLRQKDRLVMAAGGIAAILTLVTNKPYLGWQRHTWDPMLLGALLIGVALTIRRWLAAGPGEVHRGFTARRLSGMDNSKNWMNAATVAVGFVPDIISPSTPSAPSAEPGPRFGGGASGGGGATSNF